MRGAPKNAGIRLAANPSHKMSIWTATWNYSYYLEDTGQGNPLNISDLLPQKDPP
ncbi:UNVERIFIED_CONTAM: hypothetical protein Slati_2940300 [Sesamum latifolium]|uniref:Uncharacterized protein n=1 Tax=Sesamum latifolium TaxID=2727402 RepID=A0AAW2VFB9_9LAMI